ncbi:MAG: hypothetical protein H0U10_05820 [Chloroflexia bacterium]|nr:hypothetical protein [Chloroflexia bacterium]
MSPRFGVTATRFRDPDGNELCLTEREPRFEPPGSFGARQEATVAEEI